MNILMLIHCTSVLESIQMLTILQTIKKLIINLLRGNKYVFVKELCVRSQVIEGTTGGSSHPNTSLTEPEHTMQYTKFLCQHHL